MLVVPLAAVIGLLGLGNLRALRLLASSTTVTQSVLLGQLGIDVIALTAFFLLGGGPENPFTILYIVHVAMGAVILRPPLAAALTTLTLGCYALLHAVHVPLQFHAHSLPEGALVTLGRVLSFTIAAVSVSVFVVGLASTLRRRSGQLLQARDRTARTDRLRSVGTLAAGAAHELNTPLSTMGLRARRIVRRHHDDDTVRDLEVIQEQLDRCKRVVEQLLVGAGDPSASGFERAALASLVEEGIGLWAKGAHLHVRLADRSEGAEVELPRIAFTQALINLLENAREAQEEIGCADALEVSVERDGDKAMIRIRDHGCGLPETLDRVGDPFFTTKNTGTGLGVFVARAVAEGARGGLSYTTGDGGGTEARWWFPESPRRSA